MLLASTEWVYDGCDESCVDENTPIYPPAPGHLYTAAKISAETFCHSYRTLYGLNFTIIRYGIPFGERARPQTVTPIFLRKILHGETVTVHGDGEQFRQFIYVRDLAAGNVACLQPAAENQIVNINGREKVRVIDIVTTIEAITGVPAIIAKIENRRGSFAGRLVSSEKARDLLAWEPQLSYREAMERYVTWYRANNN